MLKKEFETYLVELGLTQPLINRATLIHDELLKLCPGGYEEFEDIFVSEYVTMDGRRQYEKLTFFLNNDVFSASNFLKEYDFRIAVFRGIINQFNLSKEHYDFVKATSASRMSLQVFSPGQETAGRFQASGSNCEQLFLIVKKHLTCFLQA